MARERPIRSFDEVPVIMDIPYVMRLFGLGKNVVGDACRSGELRAAKIGNQWRIRKDDAFAWFDKKCKGGVTP